MGRRDAKRYIEQQPKPGTWTRCVGQPGVSIVFMLVYSLCGAHCFAEASMDKQRVYGVSCVQAMCIYTV